MIINHTYKKSMIIVMIIILIGASSIPITIGKYNKYQDILDPFEDIKITTDGRSDNPQSTTGPVPPKNYDIGLDPNTLTGQVVISDVPAYLWRHGCGPTAAGMVIGYWDSHGYDILIPGDATSQTHFVNQAIASGGNYSNPQPSGSEQHYEDYARPEDQAPQLLTDDYITQGRTPHSDDCIADYMDTSKSTRNNYYGWSYFNDVDNAIHDYIHWVNPQYIAITTNLQWGGLTWNTYCHEIDTNHPIVLLVDTDGNGQTDHFVTAVGYDDSHNYACYNTWDTTLHWYDFSQIAISNPWGIYGATLLEFHNIAFIKPKPTLYFLNYDILELPLLQNLQWPFTIPLIIGPIDIEIQITGPYNITKVDFIINGTTKYTDPTQPYSWRWRTFTFSENTIQVVAHDSSGPVMNNEINVWKLF